MLGLQSSGFDVATLARFAGWQRSASQGQMSIRFVTALIVSRSNQKK